MATIPHTDQNFSSARKKLQSSKRHILVETVPVEVEEEAFEAEFPASMVERGHVDFAQCGSEIFFVI